MGVYGVWDGGGGGGEPYSSPSILFGLEHTFRYVVFLPPAYEVWGKVMSVILFTGRCLPSHNATGGQNPQKADPPPSRIRVLLRDTVNKRAVRILLECNLVETIYVGKKIQMY